MNAVMIMRHRIQQLLLIIVVIAAFCESHGPIRLNAEPLGKVDPNFQIQSVLSGGIGGSKVLADGKILVWGAFNHIQAHQSPGVARLHPDGSVDESFSSGLTPDIIVLELYLQSDRIIVGGMSLGSEKMYRLSADGNLDPTFSSGFEFFAPQFFNVLQDGKIIICDGLIGGQEFFENAEAPRLFRLNTEGTLDSSFQLTNDYTAVSIARVLVQPDDKLLAFGWHYKTGDSERTTIFRLFSDGSMDDSFQYELGSYVNLIPLAVQTDGKVLIGQANGPSPITMIGISLENPRHPPLMRIQPDGSLDDTFHTPLRTNSFIRSVHIQGDGRIIIGGLLFNEDESPLPPVIRLNTDGSIDGTFACALPVVDTAYHLEVQPDGDLLVANWYFLEENNETAFVRVQCIEQPRIGEFQYEQNGNIQFQITGNSHRNYEIESSVNLVTWTPVGKFLSTSKQTNFTDSSNSGLPRFYRASVLIP
jgi:uncharacterized delta-60 repeat protein